MSKVAKSFICSSCLNPVTIAGRISVDIGASAKLELVDKFCNLDDMPRFVMSRLLLVKSVYQNTNC